MQKRVLGAEHPDTLTSANNLAVSLSNQGKHAEAETILHEVLGVRKRVIGAEHPDTLGTASNLANALDGQGRLAEAEQHVLAALSQAPDDAYNLSTLGYLKFRQEKYDDALKSLSRAAQIDPNNPEIQNYLGVTLSHQGQRKAAETALRRAIQLNPNYAPAHNNLAVIYLSQTPPLAEMARWHYLKAIEAGQPHNPDLEKMLADKGAPVAP